MTSHRPYAEAVTRDKALSELFDHAGTQFDAAVVEAFAAAQSDLNAELVA